MKKKKKFFFFSVLGMKSRALSMLGKHSITDLQPQHHFHIFVAILVI
jgi:hypothetical protein